jgi:glucokinase
MKPDSTNLTIGIDLGGTNIKAALVDTHSAETLAMLSKPTRDGEFDGDTPCFALTVRDIVHEFESRAGQKLRVGLSAPGLASPGGQCINSMPGRMHGLEKLDWSTFLERDCRVLNDAHAALLGEVWAGAAKDCRDVFMLTLGTNVGGAIYSGGRLLRGAIGRAGHLGHISIDSQAPRDDFNPPGSLGHAIGNRTLVQRSDGRFTTTHALLDAAAAGDEHAQAMWLTSVRHQELAR